MEQPANFKAPGEEGCVMRPMESIHGMRQAWMESDFPQELGGWGFTRVSGELCVCVCHPPFGTVIFAVHVDNIISVASSPEENKFPEQTGIFPILVSSSNTTLTPFPCPNMPSLTAPSNALAKTMCAVIGSTDRSRRNITCKPEKTSGDSRVIHALLSIRAH